MEKKINRCVIRTGETDIKIHLIDNFPNHPYHVFDDEDMTELAASIEANGLLNPIIVRSKADGRYELISGHRRKRAYEILKINKIRAIIVDVSDDEAIIMMVDSNCQRSKILPSEKAFSYKMKLDAIKRQGNDEEYEILKQITDESYRLTFTTTEDGYIQLSIAIEYFYELENADELLKELFNDDEQLNEIMDEIKQAQVAEVLSMPHVKAFLKRNAEATGMTEQEVFDRMMEIIENEPERVEQWFKDQDAKMEDMFPGFPK